MCVSLHVNDYSLVGGECHLSMYIRIWTLRKPKLNFVIFAMLTDIEKKYIAVIT